MIALVVVLLALVAAGPAAAAPQLVPVPGTYAQPVHMSAPPADPHRLFVVEKAGVVKVVVDGGAPKVFLDISAEVDDDGEEGLLSIGFARDYATSRRFYLYFTADLAGNSGSIIRIAEFTRPEGTPDSGEGSTRRTLLDVQHPDATNHNGGQLQIGPDGLVWLATGDGAVTPSDAQDPSSLLGKLLRLDPASSAPPEVFASGLRNPWRFSFDRQTGDLALGDVGAGTREEVDFLTAGTAAGSNFEWPCREGSVAGPVGCVVAANATAPVFDYDSTSFGCGVTGGYVVRDPALPTLVGRYLYGDLCRSKLRSIVLATPASDREEELSPGGTVVSFGEDSCGHVYVVSIGGSVSRVDDEPFTPCPEEPGGGPGGSGGPGGDPPGGNPGGDPPGGGRTGDRTPPVLKVSRARHQKLLLKKAVYIGVACDELCGTTTEANARLSVRGSLKKYAFGPAGALATTGQRQRLRLKLSKAMRAGLGTALARGARPLVKVVVIARDAAGNETRRTVFVRVVG